jgi:hypothetical protein
MIPFVQHHYMSNRAERRDGPPRRETELELFQRVARNRAAERAAERRRRVLDRLGARRRRR